MEVQGRREIRTEWRFSRIAIALIIAALAAMTANCSRTMFAVLNAPAYGVGFDRYADLRYGDQGRQSLDVYVPSRPGSSPRPIVIFWYGGVWTKGSKEEYRFVGAALARSGYVAVLPDYRLYPQVRFPQFVDDGALAVKWVQQHARKFGGDPEALFLMGHSAGAHIAALVALDPRYLRRVGADPGQVRGWIGLSGPYDLHTDIPGKPILRDIFRAPHSEGEWQVVSLANRHSPRTLLIHGTDDIDPREAVALAERLQATGTHVECRIYPNVTHMMTVAAFSVPLRPAAPALEDVRGFIDRSLSASSDDAPCPILRLVKDTTTVGMRAEIQASTSSPGEQ